MTQQESTNEIRAGEVEVRQHVILPRNGTAAVYRVEQRLTYHPGDNSNEMVLLTLVPAGGGTPPVERRWTEALIELATDDQVAAAVEAVHRKRIAAGLRDLADQIELAKVRFRAWHGVNVSASLPDGEVSRLAELLNVKLDDYGAESKRVFWTLRASDAGDGVSVSFYGTPAPEPAVAEQEWLFTFGSGQQHDGRFVRITGTYDTARTRMLEVFGNRWCAQYDWRRFDEEGLPARLTELPESEWPAPAAPDGE
ncbi:hypothetical protein [Micromonospora sediminicola]|uniref:hypothetical protein n=1 Tax=Micromonospora sediminicola TaxID=946078 RepID=UPI0037B16BB5